MSPSARDDYIMRLVAQVIQALLRIAGLRQAGKTEEALQEIHATYALLLGPFADVASRLDPASAAQIINNAEQILAWARLLKSEADLWRLEGEPARADALEKRALALAREARTRQPSDPAAAEEFIRLLSTGADSAG